VYANDAFHHVKPVQVPLRFVIHALISLASYSMENALMFVLLAMLQILMPKPVLVAYLDAIYVVLKIVPSVSSAQTN